MRLVSQDGKIDMPYEMVGIFRFKAEIYFLNRNLTGVIPLDGDVRLATYSTGEKAIKAMEMLKRAYENNMFYHCMANRKGYIEAQSALGAEQFRKATTEYFQFPQDDEIEV